MAPKNSTPPLATLNTITTHNTHPLWFGALLAFGAALFTAAAFPPLSWWPLAILGPALLYFAATRCHHQRTLLAGAILGAIYGAVFMAIHVTWAIPASGPMGWIGLTLSQLGFYTLLGVLLAVSRVLNTRTRIAAATGAWVLIELMRSHMPWGGFGWGRLVFSQAEAPTAWLAAVTGPASVTALLAFVAACGTELVTTGPGLRRYFTTSSAIAGGVGASAARGASAGQDDSAGQAARDDASEIATGGDPATPTSAGGHPSPVRWVAAVAATALLVVAPAAASWFRTEPDTTSEEYTTWDVVVVQGNTPRLGLDHFKPRGVVLNNHVTATSDYLANNPTPDLIVWPEASADINPFRTPAVSDTLTDLAQSTDAPLLIGSYTSGGHQLPSTAADPNPQASYNTVLLWGPTGPTAQYHKRHPVPFGEYIPHRSFFERITPLVRQVVVDLTAGTDIGIFTINNRPVGALICFEVSDDALTADTINAGAQLLTVHTNTAWFGTSPESAQQLAMSQIRAIEHNRWVAHASTVGISAIIDPTGKVHDPTTIASQDVIQHRVTLNPTTTLSKHTRIPVEAALAFMGGCLSLYAASRYTKKRRQGEPQP